MKPWRSRRGCQAQRSCTYSSCEPPDTTWELELHTASPQGSQPSSPLSYLPGLQEALTGCSLFWSPACLWGLCLQWKSSLSTVWVGVGCASKQHTLRADVIPKGCLIFLDSLAIWITALTVWLPHAHHLPWSEGMCQPHLLESMGEGKGSQRPCCLHSFSLLVTFMPIPWQILLVLFFSLIRYFYKFMYFICTYLGSYSHFKLPLLPRITLLSILSLHVWFSLKTMNESLNDPASVTLSLGAHSCQWWCHWRSGGHV